MVDRVGFVESVVLEDMMMDSVDIPIDFLAMATKGMHTSPEVTHDGQ